MPQGLQALSSSLVPKCHFCSYLALLAYIYHYLRIFAVFKLNYRKRTIIHGDIAFQRFGGYKSVINECSLGVNVVIDNFSYVASDTLPLCSILKQSDN